MSETMEAPKVEEDGAPQENAETEVEARARKMGWRPKAEFLGDEDRWRPAAEYIERGETMVPLMRKRLSTMESEIQRLTKLQQDGVDVIQDMSRRMVSAEERAYKKARAELEARVDQAAESGDTDGYRAAKQQLAEVDKSKPEPPAPPKPQVQTPHPDAIEWAQRNPWYSTDPAMAAMAVGVHNALLASQPGLSMKENLEKVSAAVRTTFPEKFPKPNGATPAAANGANPRRSEPGSVSGSSPPQSSRANSKSFEAMPKDSKDAYEKYSRQIGDRGGKLTKEKWAEDYWAQFD